MSRKKYMFYSYLIGFTIIAIAFLLVPSFDEAPYKTILPDKAWKQMKANDAILVLDVRTKNEYKTGYIPGAVNVPISKIKEGSKVLPKDKNQIIYVYCETGVRSEEAARKLIELDYTKVYDLGGIDGWPYDIEK